MQKNRIIAGFTIISVVLTILVSYMIYRYMSPSRQTIYVFNGAYSAGDQVTASMLTPIQVDSTITISGRKADVSEQFITPAEYNEIVKSGDSLRMDVGEGMPLTMSMLSVIGGSSIEMNMKPSSIAVTVSVDNVTGISSELKEGSRVNIYSTTNAGVSLILQNMRILTVNKPGGDLESVTVETNLEQSLQLIYYSTYGHIYLGLIDGSGYQAEESDIPSFAGYQVAVDEVTDMTEVPEDNSTVVTDDPDLEDSLFGTGIQEDGDNSGTEAETEAGTENVPLE